MNSEEIIKRVEENIEKPFVTAKFGNYWKENAENNYSKGTLTDIAWRQGRRAILLEREIERLCNEQVTKKTFSFDYIGKAYDDGEGNIVAKQSTHNISAWDEEHATLLFKEMHPDTSFDAPY